VQVQWLASLQTHARHLLSPHQISPPSISPNFILLQCKVQRPDSFYARAHRPSSAASPAEAEAQPESDVRHDSVAGAAVGKTGDQAVVVVYRARKLQTDGLDLVGPFVDVVARVAGQERMTTGGRRRPPASYELMRC
jgi:cbb3-type cytochrome oxidase cytochrome c subunit